MDLPDLVRQAVGDEEIRAGVNLGDEDAVVFTPTRTLVYRGEGLLSDEDVAEFGFEFERLAVSEGRRKTKYTMSYVDGERSFTVPGKRTDDVLEKLIEGSLRTADVIDDDESVTGVFRFSEMTLVVAEGRLLKHIGEYTWDSDFESFAYDDLTKLAFEEGSVATQVVLGVGNRSERIKAPNAEAGVVRKTLQEAVFAHHGVDSLEELNRKIVVEPDEDGDEDGVTGGFGLDSGIDPLVSDEPDADASADDQAADVSGTESSTTDEGSRSTRSATAASGSDGSSGGRSATTGGDSADRSSTGGGRQRAEADSGATDPAVAERLATLTEAVERQNELLARQQQTIEKLIEELRQGR